MHVVCPYCAVINPVYNAEALEAKTKRDAARCCNTVQYDIEFIMYARRLAGSSLVYHMKPQPKTNEKELKLRG